MWNIINKIFPIGVIVFVNIISVGICVPLLRTVSKEAVSLQMCLFLLFLFVLLIGSGILIVKVLRGK